MKNRRKHNKIKRAGICLSVVLGMLATENMPVYANQMGNTPRTVTGGANISDMTVPVEATMDFSYTVSVPAQLEFLRADEVMEYVEFISLESGQSYTFKAKTFSDNLKLSDNNGTYYCCVDIDVEIEGEGNGRVDLKISSPLMTSSDKNVQSKIVSLDPTGKSLVEKITGYTDEEIAGNDSSFKGGSEYKSALLEVNQMRGEMGDSDEAIDITTLSEDTQDFVNAMYDYNEFCIANSIVNFYETYYSDLMYGINPNGENDPADKHWNSLNNLRNMYEKMEIPVFGYAESDYQDYQYDNIYKSGAAVYLLRADFDRSGVYEGNMTVEFHAVPSSQELMP